MKMKRMRLYPQLAMGRLRVTCMAWFLTLFLFLGGSAYAELRDFTFTITESTLKLKGMEFPVWTFSGTVPGPEIRVKEGDAVRIRLINRSNAYHTLTFHGLHVPFSMAGIPGYSQEPVGPDEEFTYEFVAKPSGTHYYHCNVNLAEHLDMGMYGAFIVEPREDEVKADKEFVYILDEWNSSALRGKDHHGTGHPRSLKDYDIITINGKAVTEDAPMVMEVKKGERVRIRLINVGYLPHALRFPDGFTITHEDGYPLVEPRKETSLTIYPGKRYDIVFTAEREGRKPFYHTITFPKPFRHGLSHGEDIDKPQREEGVIILDVGGPS